MKAFMCLVLLVSFTRQFKQHVLQTTSSGRTKHLTISDQQYQDISSKYGNIRHYHHQVVSGRNRLNSWTEKAVGTFFSYFCVFFRLSFPFINLLGDFLSPVPYSILFIIIKYLSIVTTEI